MQIETIGAVVIVCGLVGWFVGPRFAVPVFFASTLLSAAAALILTSLGGANIQPAHLLLGFLAVASLSSRTSLLQIGEVLVFPRAGFWLVMTAAYAALSAFFLPRIFAGMT